MTLETAKQLKELGLYESFKKETYWCWANAQKTTNGNDRIDNWELMETERACNNGYDYHPSPSLEALLAVMPSYILVPKGNYIVSTKGRVTNEMFLHIKKGELYWACYTDSYSNNLEGFIFSNEVFSEAVAMLWVQLRKEGIV